LRTESLTEFNQRVSAALADIGSDLLDYNREEFWIVKYHYDYLENFARERRFFNTCIALPLARGIHNGSYRKSPYIVNGHSYRLPYVIHCLTVCKMLADLRIPLPDEQYDVMLAAALCHDMIEDVPFPENGKEIYTRFHMSPEVYNTVLTVSKRYDFTPEEEQEFFLNICRNRLAMLIKLSDRGHNVTDLYNMKEWKIHEYIGETRKFFMPMCVYAREHYPELSEVIEIMQDQLVVLTKTAEVLVERHGKIVSELQDKINALRGENAALRAKLEEDAV